MTTDLAPTYKLGKAPATVDPLDAKLADFIDYKTIPVHPANNAYSPLIANWLMLGNDAHGDCVYAGEMHREMLVSKVAGTPWVPDTQAVVDDYLRLSPNDGGLVIRDFLKYRRKNQGAGPHKMLGFASVNWLDHEMMSLASWLFYGVLRGILLPKTAQAQTGPTGLWDVTGVQGDGRPGTWGGHLTLSADYTQAYGTKEITWGFAQPATPRFWDTYCDESWVVVPDYPIPGFKLNDFKDYLRSIGANVDVDPNDPTPDPPPPPPPPAPDDINVLIREKLGYWTGVDFTFSKGAKWHGDVIAPPGG